MAQATIKRAVHDGDNPYFQMRRDSAQDKTLSWEARGVLCYLLSQPDDWEILVSDLEQECGRDRVYRIINELKSKRYLKDRIKLQQLDGTWVWTPYIVYEKPYPENTDMETVSVKSVYGKPQHGKPYTVNTEIIQTTDNKIDIQKKNPPLPPQGECDAKTPDDEYTTMSNAVKSLLKQHNKTQRHSIVNALLQRHTGNKADMNVECLMTVEMLGEFCLWWDKTKIGRDSKPLTRPKNQGSVKQWVDEWLSERNSVTPVTNQPTRDIREIFKGRYIPVASTGE